MKVRVALRIVAAGLTLLLVACAADVRIQHSRPPGQTVRIAAEDRIYVTRPGDGSYRGKLYAGSGDELLRALVAAVSTHTSPTNVSVASSTEPDLATSLDHARAERATFLLQPAILRWEERVTPWTGLLDHARLRITLYDVGSGELIDAADIEIEGPRLWNSAQRIGALLRDPLVRYVGSVF
jgi:Domain of unknown function (DUF4823)